MALIVPGQRPRGNCRIGYEIVPGAMDKTYGKYSFRIIFNGRVVKTADCPMWFDSEAAAKTCADQMADAAVADFRRRGTKVEKFRY